jgi:peroxiredoxin
LPDFDFVTIDGASRRLSDFRGRKHLVLIFADRNDNAFLNAVARANPAIRDLEAHVIAILRATPGVLDAYSPQRWPFDVAVDSRGGLHRAFNAEDDQGASGLAVYVTDRWAEVVYACRTLQGDPAPGIEDLLEWLTFVDHECPECFPSEWPA